MKYKEIYRIDGINIVEGTDECGNVHLEIKWQPSMKHYFWCDEFEMWNQLTISKDLLKGLKDNAQTR